MLQDSQSRDETMLNELQCESFRYFIHATNCDNGLVADKTREDWPASIAATGMALAAYAPAVARGFISRGEAVERTLGSLRFFWNSPQSKDANATGYKGFYYHFLDMKTGRRVWNCELSTVDTGFLLAGMLAAAQYFHRETRDEQEIRTLAHKLYARANWQWALNGKPLSLTAGNRKPVFCCIGGKGTARHYCSMCSVWLRQLIRYLKKATRLSLRPIRGNGFTIMNSFIQARSLRTNCHMCGLTFAESRTAS